MKNWERDKDATPAEIAVFVVFAITVAAVFCSLLFDAVDRQDTYDRERLNGNLSIGQREDIMRRHK